jgi:hypothetical protein
MFTVDTWSLVRVVFGGWIQVAPGREGGFGMAERGGEAQGRMGGRVWLEAFSNKHKLFGFRLAPKGFRSWTRAIASCTVGKDAVDRPKKMQCADTNDNAGVMPIAAGMRLKWKRA